MSHKPDLALPERIPEIEWHLHESERLVPFALYFMYDSDDAEMETLRKLCTKDQGDLSPRDDNDLADRTVKLPPQAKFVGQRLRSIVDYHIELVKDPKREFDWNYFIVCVYPACSIVLLVTLDGGECQCIPDSSWIRIESASLELVNLQIANVGWDETKDSASEVIARSYS